MQTIAIDLLWSVTGGADNETHISTPDAQINRSQTNQEYCQANVSRACTDASRNLFGYGWPDQGAANQCIAQQTPIKCPTPGMS